jgi:hypothetical protein
MGDQSRLQVTPRPARLRQIGHRRRPIERPRLDHGLTATSTIRLVPMAASALAAELGACMHPSGTTAPEANPWPDLRNAYLATIAITCSPSATPLLLVHLNHAVALDSHARRLLHCQSDIRLMPRDSSSSRIGPNHERTGLD